jgi:peptide-methionine (S)-S-oxide reductase
VNEIVIDLFPRPLADTGRTGKGYQMTSRRRPLPPNPSSEFLRKEAKRFAKARKLKLSEAQRRLAAEYGFDDWPRLIAHVEDEKPLNDRPATPLARAARISDVAEVRRLLAGGAAADDGEEFSPLWHACAGEGVVDKRVEIAAALLAAGAPALRENGGRTPTLCIAAARGPKALVELLIRRGARTWQADAKGRDALAWARTGSAPDREAIIHLLDRPVIDDPIFGAAVKAIQTGDVDGLNALLDRHPDLLKQRAREPDCYSQDYFRDPKLFWFLAFNPIPPMPCPRNIVAITEAMVARGVEQTDLDYTIGLVMTGSRLREQRLQTPMILALLTAGAEAGGMVMVLGHKERAAVEAILKAGHLMTAVIAAGTGRAKELAELLPSASAAELHSAFSVAVINGEVECAGLCLDAGASISALLSAHRHSTAAHQAAINDDVAMLKLLVERGADLSARDTAWNGTPLGWAKHEKRKKAETYLEEVMKGRAS